MTEPFNVGDYEPMQDFEALPAGEYTVFPYTYEKKQTKSGGWMLTLTWEIIDGQFKGRKLWSRLNLQNANPKAVEIANSELATICRACGVGTLADKWEPVEINGKTLVVKVAKVPHHSGEGMTNEVKNYYPVTGEPYDAPAPAKAAPAAKGGADDDDDLPF